MSISISIVLLIVFTCITVSKIKQYYETSVTTDNKLEYEYLDRMIALWAFVLLLVGFGWMSLFP